MSEAVNLKVPIKDCLATAIFNLDLDMVNRLLDTKAFDKTAFGNVCLIEGHYCPINWIPQLWDEIIDDPDTWCEEYREKIVMKLKANQEIKRILTEEMKIEFFPIEIRNNSLWKYQWLAEMSFEEFYSITKEVNEIKVRKDIDKILYYYVNQYNFEESKKLLQLGANPQSEIPEEGSCCLSLVEERCAQCYYELSHILLEEQTQDSLDYRKLANLLSWGVNIMMFNLLCEYKLVDSSHQRNIK